MAEAHSAVAFQFAVTDEGVVLHFDKAAIQSAALAVLHILHNRYSRVKTAFLKGIFPATPLSLLVLTSGVLTFYAVGVDPTFGVLSLFSPIPRCVLSTYDRILFFLMNGMPSCEMTFFF